MRQYGITSFRAAQKVWFDLLNYIRPGEILVCFLAIGSKKSAQCQKRKPFREKVGVKERDRKEKRKKKLQLSSVSCG